MREFSKVAPNVWQSRKFWQLPDDDARFAYLYLLTNVHVNSAGCYDLLEGYAVTDLRWSAERFAKALASLCHIHLIELDADENTILITNWTTFNEPTNARHAHGILNQLNKASSVSLKSLRAKEFWQTIVAKQFDRDRTMAKPLRSLFEALTEGIPTRPRPDLDRDLDQTEIKTETQTETPQPANGAVAASPIGAAPPPSDEPDLPSYLDTPFLRRHA